MNPPTTHWSVVLEARNGDGDTAHAALTTLCATYWMPLYVYVRSRGYQVDDAEELTQGFFAQLLDKKFLNNVQQGQGKFRNYLLTSMQHFISSEHRMDQAKKRGGGRQRLSIDVPDAEGRLGLGLTDHNDPERAFCRQWAITLLDTCFRNLAREQNSTAKTLRFDLLRDDVTATDKEVPYSQLADQSGVSAGALRVAVHRLRNRYGELLRNEIGRTLEHSETIDDELDELFAALAGRG